MTTTKTDTRTLARVQARLKREASEFEIAGLDDRARAVRAELARVDGLLADAAAERQEENSERWRAEREDRERHEAAERRRAEDAERRQAAAEWLQGQLWNGQPVETVETLAAASREGHAAADVLAVSRRYRRRADGAEVLAPASLAFMVRDFVPVDGA
jgi:hypothetical protein